MEISGEVDITIDQYADFEIDLDVDRLAEELATDHNFVDDTVLHAHVEEYCDSYVDDLVTERVHQETQELRVQVSELEPNNNYVRINDLRTIIREEIDTSGRDASTGLTPTEFTTLVQSIVREEIRAALDAAAKWYPSA